MIDSRYTEEQFGKLRSGCECTQTDGRLKSLFWPTLRHDGDIEYITEQGFWICLLVGGLRCMLVSLQAHFVASLFDFAFFFLAGVGVRQRSKLASIVAFSVYFGSACLAQRLTGSGFGVVTIIFLALLLANVRGIWLSSRWTKTDLPNVERLNDTFFDKLSGRIPEVLWPKAKWLFRVLACLELGSLAIVLFAPQPPHPLR